MTIKLDKLLNVIGNCLHKHQSMIDARKKGTNTEPEDEPNSAAKEKGKRMRDAIMELVEECKRVTMALAEQVVEGKATVEVIEENL